jgi:hypothetical protein
MFLYPPKVGEKRQQTTIDRTPVFLVQCLTCKCKVRNTKYEITAKGKNSMLYDGLQFHKANHLAWRKADSDRDKDIYGNPVPANCVVIVRMDDCVASWWTNGEIKIDPSQAPAIPFICHTSTNVLSGIPRRCYKPFVDMAGRTHTFHYTITKYLVHDDRVWTATYHMSPEVLVVKQYLAYKNDKKQ